MAGSADEASSSQAAGRPNSYVARACDECRKRKMRCDGTRPQCSVCKERKERCHWNDKDRRKSNVEQLEDLRNRMDRFESLLESLVASAPSRNTTDISPTALILQTPRGFQAGEHAAPSDPSRQPSYPIPVEQRPIRPLPSRVTALTTPPPALQNLDIATFSSTSQTSSQQIPAHVELTAMKRDSNRDARVQFGTTSLWAHKSPVTRPPPVASIPSPLDLMPGDRVDWSRNLPPFVNIDRGAHDAALEYFGAYYGPWTNIIDMSAFLADLEACNLVRAAAGEPPPPSRTAHYSPLLHCCLLFLGLNFIRSIYPDLMRSLESVFVQHCTSLLVEECDFPTLSSLKAYNLFSTCAHYCHFATHTIQSTEERQHSTGYLFSGIAIAGIHTLALNTDCKGVVDQGNMTPQERNMRIDSYWHIYLQDVIRAMAVGRQPMLPDPSGLPLPAIDPKVDDTPWVAPLRYGLTSTGPIASVNGSRSMRSTVFHWAVRLGVMLRTMINTMYSARTGDSRNESSILEISQQLEQWYRHFPIHPAEATPVPHALLLHMQYHLMVILVHRPFYRLDTPSAADKCNQAATSVLRLLHTFEETHGLRNAHHNLINIVFGAATIFLLQCVGTPTDETAQLAHIRDFDRCVEFTGRLASTWVEAELVREVLLSLRSEYHPDAQQGSTEQTTGISTDQFDELQHWLDTQDYWNMLFPDQSQIMPWGDVGQV